MHPKEGPRKNQLSIRINDETMERLVALAKRHELDLSEAVRQSIDLAYMIQKQGRKQ